MDDSVALSNLIARFALAFDMKDWGALRDCLADRVHTDYSDLRGAPAATVDANDYVRARRDALERTALASRRWDRRDRHRWRDGHMSRLYTFGARKDASWKLDAITQRVLWNGE